MNKITTSLTVVTICLVLAVSCAKDKARSPVTNTTSTSTTTTTGGTTTGTTAVQPCDTVTYAKHIEPIIKTNCAISGCHNQSGAQGGVVLLDYNNVKDKADQGRIKARVLDGTGGWMPYGSPSGLPDAQKQLIKCWLEKGAPNN